MAEKETPKYLRNKRTGAVQTYHPRKALMPDMEPWDEPPKPRTGLKRRTKRPFDEEQERRALEARGEEARQEAVREKVSQEDPDLPILTAEQLDEAEQQVKSALKKDDIASVAMDYFGIKISTEKGVKRADMKSDVLRMIELARSELGGEG